MTPSVTISVITICFNNLQELIATLHSVEKQTMPPHEHLIIDGSTSTEIYEYLKSASHPVYRQWISEKDKGIADAFNKGIRWSTGTVVNMLNAGDTYFDDSILATVAEEFTDDPSLAWLHGKFVLQRGGIWVTIGKPFDPALLYRGMRSLSHQSMFVKKSLHDKYGFYDIALRNAMDYDFVCRIAGENFVFINQALIVFAPGGTTDRDYLKALREGRQVFEKHFGRSWKLSLWQLRLRTLRRILDGPFGTALYKLKVLLKLENA